MLPDTVTDAGLFGALLDVNGERRASSGAFHRLDHGSIGHGSLFCITHPDGYFDVFDANDATRAARSYTG